MKVQKWGRIVNSTSSSVKQVIENLILSNTLRLGVIGLTKTLSQELAPYNILINAIGPGRFDTQRIRQACRFPLFRGKQLHHGANHTCRRRNGKSSSLKPQR